MDNKKSYTPIIIADDYKNINGRNLSAEKISIGLSSDDSSEIYCKTDTMSAIPAHQILDLAILTCCAKQYVMNAYHAEKEHQNNIIERIGLQGDAMTVSICPEQSDAGQLAAAFSRDDELISERLATLSRILKNMGY